MAGKIKAEAAEMRTRMLDAGRLVFYAKDDSKTTFLQMAEGEFNVEKR